MMSTAVAPQTAQNTLLLSSLELRAKSLLKEMNSLDYSGHDYSLDFDSNSDFDSEPYDLEGHHFDEFDDFDDFDEYSDSLISDVMTSTELLQKDTLTQTLVKSKDKTTLDTKDKTTLDTKDKTTLDTLVKVTRDEQLIQQLSSLGVDKKISCLLVKMTEFDLFQSNESTQSNDTLSSVWIEYSTASSIQMNNNYIRFNLQIPKSTRHTQNSTVKTSTMTSTRHTQKITNTNTAPLIKIPIDFKREHPTPLWISNPESAFRDFNVKVYALANNKTTTTSTSTTSTSKSKSAIPTSNSSKAKYPGKQPPVVESTPPSTTTASSSDFVEIWSAVGSFKESDVVYTKDLSLSTTIPLQNTLSPLHKFSPNSIPAQLHLTLTLVPSPLPPPSHFTISQFRSTRIGPGAVVYCRFKTSKHTSLETPRHVYTSSLNSSFTFNYHTLIRDPVGQIVVEVWTDTGLIGVARVQGDVYGEVAVVDFEGGVGGWITCSLLDRDSVVDDDVESIHKEVVEESPVEDVVELDLQDEKEEIVELEEREEEDGETTTLNIIIHEATGLQSLLPPDHPLTPLAITKGPNTYITLDLFRNNDPIQTPIIAHSATPTYDHSMSVTIQASQSSIQDWIKSGGKALGTIYLTSPRHISHTSVQLATFDPDLSPLFLSGIYKKWHTCIGGIGAVCLSIYTDASFPIPSSPLYTLTYTPLSILVNDKPVHFTSADSVVVVQAETIKELGTDIHLSPFGSSFLTLESEVRRVQQFGMVEGEKWVQVIPRTPEWRDIKALVRYRFGREARDETAYLSESFIEDISRIERNGKVEIEVEEEEEPEIDSVPIPVEVVEEVKVDPFLEPVHEQVVEPNHSLEPSPTNIPIYISIEKAMNLPLVSDPLGSSFPSPFVKSSDSFTSTLPNAFVTLSPPLPSYTQTQTSTSIIYNQTNPVWNLQTCLSLSLPHPSTLRSVRSSPLRFKVWHTPHEAGCEDAEMLGVCVVSLDPLFTGMSEIHGWYPIQDTDGLSKGQLMVRVCPTFDLGDLYRGLERVVEEDVVVESRATPFFLLEKEEVVDKVEVEKPQETFVWNGKQWIQKQVPSSAPSSSSPSKPMTASLFEKSISETINDLEMLKKSIMTKLHKLNSSPESKGTQVHEPETRETGTDAAVLAMSLPVDESFVAASSFSGDGSGDALVVDDLDSRPVADKGVDQTHSSNPFKDDTMNESRIAFELNQYENNVLKAAADFSASIGDTSDPAIVRTNDLLDKLDILQLTDPSFMSDSVLSLSEEQGSPTRQQIKNMLQFVASSRTADESQEGFEYSKPPLAPTTGPPIGYASSSSMKWKELDRTSQPTTTVPTQDRSSGSSSLALMQQRLGNVSLESSTRIANVLRKSTNSEPPSGS